MPSITITLTTGQAQRLQAAFEGRLLGHYIEDTGNPSPTPQELGEWCFKRLGKRFVDRYERDIYIDAYDEPPFESP